MSSGTLIRILGANALSLMVLAGPLAAQSVAQTAPVTVIRQARVFDGTRIIGVRDVLIRPANLSAAKSINVWARGDGKTYKIMLFSQGKGMQPLMKDFVAGAEWKEYNFPFAGFDGIDGSDIMGIAFTGGPAAGTFSMQLDEVSLR